MRHDRRCFGRLEQEDQRLKKHYGRWMDIVWSLELESFKLSKLTKPFVPVNLVGPQVSLPPRWVPASRGSIHFFCLIRRHFWWVRADSGGNVFFAKYGGPSGGSQQSGETIFFAKYWWPVWWVPAVRWRNNYFARNKEALPCGCRGPSCQPLHVHSTSDGSRSLTTLTTPCREHHGGGRWRGLGRGRRGAGEDAAVDAHTERSMRFHWFGCAAVAAE